MPHVKHPFIEPPPVMTADQFREWLRNTGIRQIEIAEALGATPTTVNRWLSGNLPIPPYALAWLLLAARHITATADLDELKGAAD